MVELRELGDEPDEVGRELGEESPAWPETWSSTESSATAMRARRGVPSVAGDMVKQRELGDERRELGEISVRIGKSSTTNSESSTTSGESSARAR
jgi:hypothetical protein